MKKLLIYVNSMNTFGGIERVIANLSNVWCDNFEVTILVKDAPTSSYSLNKSINIESLNCDLKLNMNSRIQRIINIFINYFDSTMKLKKYFNTNRYDYIYVSMVVNLYELYFSNKDIRKKIIASEHGSFYAYNKIYKVMKSWIYPRLVAISVPTITDTKIYNEKGYNAFYIPHIATFKECKCNDLKESTIINVGRLTDDKQQLLLLKMWNEINKKSPNHNYNLQIIGSGENYDKLKEYIIINKIRNVQLVGHTDNISEYYKKASLFLFTSKMEGFGMVLLEAMSFGVPCISFDCHSGPRDIIKNNYNGFLIPCYDEILFEKCVCDYIDMSNEEKLTYQNNALQTISNWNNDEILKKWKKIFNKVEIQQ